MTKDLKVGGSSLTIKGGQTVKKNRLTDNPEEVNCKIDGMRVTLTTCFVRKVQ